MPVDVERCREVAAYFVDSGRFVPGIVTSPEGQARSQWWPLPAAGDRALVASLVAEDTLDAHREAAAALTDAVDACVRQRLVAARSDVAGRRPGRRTIPQAWAATLTTADPWLAGTYDPAKVAAFAGEVERWVRSGSAVAASVQLCLRIIEPLAIDVTADGEAAWTVELFARDVDEPSVVVSIEELWNGTA